VPVRFRVPPHISASASCCDFRFRVPTGPDQATADTTRRALPMLVQ
jgi:hypothetical protein